jgi:tyrosinase
MAVRRSISNAAARAAYVQGVTLLKNEPSGATTGSLGIPGPAKPVSTYDLFVIWHHWAMNQFTPATQGDRNAAHRGPVFLPWHRMMLIQFEAQLQRVLADPDFGVPYWNWAADGERRLQDQPSAPIWGPNVMGGNGDLTAGGAVSSGPFSPNAGWTVEIATDSNDNLRSVSRPLRRVFNITVGLPKRSDVTNVVRQTSYDAPQWNAASPGFRDRLEGWIPSPGPYLHNRVHVWVGGDMLISSSPNDPVFYLNHCNVDRIWELWQRRGHRNTYRPLQSADPSLFRHRIDDPMYSIFAAGNNGQTPRQMLDASTIYTYSTLAL